jgi:hypothetical protein
VSCGKFKNIIKPCRTDHYEIQTMHTKEATLEEIFIKVTGRELV